MNRALWVGAVLLAACGVGLDAQVVQVVDERPTAGGGTIVVVPVPPLPARTMWSPPIIDVVIQEDSATASRRRTDAMLSGLIARVVEQEAACGREAREWAWPACKAFLECQVAGKAAARREAVHGFQAKARCSAAYHRTLSGGAAELALLRAEAQHFEQCGQGARPCESPSAESEAAARASAHVDRLLERVRAREGDWFARQAPKATGCSRPPSMRAERWNLMGADQQALACQGLLLIPPAK